MSERGAPLRVALNAVSLLSPHAGVATYIRNLVPALLATGEVRLRLFYGLAWSERLRDKGFPGFAAGAGIARRWLPWAWELNRAVQGMAFRVGSWGRFDLYHEPAYLLHSEALPSVVTVHDLSFVHYPETHPPGRVRIVAKRLPRSLHAARQVLTDSESVREETIRVYGLPPDKVHAAPLGVGPQFAPRKAEFLRPALQRVDLVPGRYVLSVGTLEPRKNLVRLLRAYALLPAALRERYPIVVVGARGWHEHPILSQMDRLRARGELRFLDYVDDDTLVSLYAGARTLAYVSVYEGFGLPIVEAMASGTSVLTSNRGAMLELGKNAAVLVDPMDLEAISGGLRQLLEDDTVHAQVRAAGRRRARDFTWSECARRTLAAYQRALSA